MKGILQGYNERGTPYPGTVEAFGVNAIQARLILAGKEVRVLLSSDGDFTVLTGKVGNATKAITGGVLK